MHNNLQETEHMLDANLLLVTGLSHAHTCTHAHMHNNLQETEHMLDANLLLVTGLSHMHTCTHAQSILNQW